VHILNIKGVRILNIKGVRILNIKGVRITPHTSAGAPAAVCSIVCSIHYSPSAGAPAAERAPLDSRSLNSPSPEGSIVCI
jgi:hypothetical protein